ncbi:uncharacterized protein LOC117588940 [Drosophila guanche]|uniref:MD-2-related lipid-recognition domain-containing protein n=1 Tax=Drosophila guanche TaxID=7266 RepID=A0A3B0K112_DROGU|nr:uncharacterized protein LOC117588940 [Drosophila guanche]SPP87013.1 Hypothetical predicted protein [Drosophila guanche]
METLLYKWILLGSLMICHAHVTFTNLKCVMVDKSFGDIKCHIKAVNRTHKYIDLTARLFKGPADNISVNLKLMRYNHGYKPFFIELSYDACKFLKNPKNPFVTSFYNTFRKNSNLNHTCPFDHDLIVDKLYTGNLENNFSNFPSLMNGDYAFFTEWFMNKIQRSYVNIYFRLTGSKEN